MPDESFGLWKSRRKISAIIGDPSLAVEPSMAFKGALGTLFFLSRQCPLDGQGAENWGKGDMLMLAQS